MYWFNLIQIEDYIILVVSGMLQVARHSEILCSDQRTMKIWRLYGMVQQNKVTLAVLCSQLDFANRNTTEKKYD